jgi:hypothetical protein
MRGERSARHALIGGKKDTVPVGQSLVLARRGNEIVRTVDVNHGDDEACYTNAIRHSEAHKHHICDGFSIVPESINS